MKNNIYIFGAGPIGCEYYNLFTEIGYKPLLLTNSIETKDKLSNNFNIITISKLKKFKVIFEFSYFFISRAINIPLTHVDGEKHKITGTNENKLKELIKEAGPENVILSSDSGVSVLPLPHISFSKFIKIIINFGFSKKEINHMIKINSKKLFNL